MDTLNVYLYGVLTALAAIAALFFLRYWRSSGDRFFVFLAGSFAALGANWASLAAQPNDEHTALFYLPRLGAFLLLLAGIADKNRREHSGT